MSDVQALKRALRPRCVAVYGASEDLSKFGGTTMAALRNQSFAGRVVPVTTRQAEVFGIAAHAQLAGSGITADLVLIAVPRAQVPTCLRDAAAAGAACAVVVTAGYAEAGTEDGRAAERELAELARSLGIRLIGPNCNGVMVGSVGLYLGPNILALKVPKLAPGPLALISQSGAVMGTLMAQAHEIGIGTGLCVSLGNQADLHAADFLEYAIGQAELSTIALYLESVAEPQRLLALARRAIAAGKQVLALKAGRTEVGAQAAMSHTGSLVGSYAVFAAACADAGVIVCESLRELVVAAWAVGRHAGLAVPTVGIVSPSGGAAGLLADRLSEQGFAQPVPAAASWEAAAPQLPERSRQFPVDIGVLLQYLPVVDADVMERFYRSLLADAAVGAVAMQATTVIGAKRLAEAAARAGRSATKPFLIVDISAGLNSELQDALRAAGVQGLRSEEDLLYALKALRGKAAAARSVDRVPLLAGRGALPPSSLPVQPTEDELKQYLAGFGVPVVAERVVRSAAEAAAAAAAIGWPVALKVRIRHIVHKTEVGGVALGLADEPALRRAFAEMAARLADQAGSEGFACVVQRMQPAPLAELLVGARCESGFGTFIALGAGGTLVELLDDTCLLPAPAAPAQILEGLQGLRVARLLQGYRGSAGADMPQLAHVIARISHAFASLGDRLKEADINPLLVTRDGPVVVDAAATLSATSGAA